MKTGTSCLPTQLSAYITGTLIYCFLNDLIVSEFLHIKSTCICKTSIPSVDINCIEMFDSICYRVGTRVRLLLWYIRVQRLQAIHWHLIALFDNIV